MKNSLMVIILIIVFTSCEKLEYEIPVQIINNDGGSYSEGFEKAIKNKLSRRNFLVVDYETNYAVTISGFYIQESFDYETVYDDCNGGTVEYELRTEWLNGVVTLWNGNEIVKEWKVEASESEHLKGGEPLLIDILTPDCEDDGDCPECTEYYIKSPLVININNDLRLTAKRIANYMVDMMNN